MPEKFKHHGAKSKYDLASIEADYRTGLLSNYRIARNHNCSEAMVRKWAIKFAWKRDLTEQVRREADNQVIRESVPEVDCKTEKQVVAEAASMRARVILDQQARIRHLTAVYDDLSSRINLNRELLAAAQSAENRDEGKIFELWKELEALLSGMLKVLTALVSLERRVFNLDEKERPVTLEEILGALPTEFSEAVKVSLAAGLN